MKKALGYDCEKRGLGFCSTSELFVKFMEKKEKKGVAVKTYENIKLYWTNLRNGFPVSLT